MSQPVRFTASQPNKQDNPPFFPSSNQIGNITVGRFKISDFVQPLVWMKTNFYSKNDFFIFYLKIERCPLGIFIIQCESKFKKVCRLGIHIHYSMRIKI